MWLFFQISDYFWLWYSPRRETHSIGPEQQHTWSTLMVVPSSGPLLRSCQGSPFKAPAFTPPNYPGHPHAEDNCRTWHSRTLNNKASKQKSKLKSCRNNTSVPSGRVLPFLKLVPLCHVKFDVLRKCTCVVQTLREHTTDSLKAFSLISTYSYWHV